MEDRTWLELIVACRDDEADSLREIERDMVAARLRVEMAEQALAWMQADRNRSLDRLVRLTEICIGHEVEVQGGKHAPRRKGRGSMACSEGREAEPAATGGCAGAEAAGDHRGDRVERGADASGLHPHGSGCHCQAKRP